MVDLLLDCLIIVFGFASLFIAVVYPRTILAVLLSAGAYLLAPGGFICIMGSIATYLAYCIDTKSLMYTDIGFMTVIKEMETKGKPEYLGKLAMDFRGTDDEDKREMIAEDYANAVEYLIARGDWREIPPLEDQLPDEYMPESFNRYWQK